MQRVAHGIRVEKRFRDSMDGSNIVMVPSSLQAMEADNAMIEKSARQWAQ